MTDDDKPSPTLEPASSGTTVERAEDLPVVARLVIEVRSDGSRTVARGALEDAITGQTVRVDAAGTTPQALAAALPRSLFAQPQYGLLGPDAPRVGRRIRGLLPGKR